MVIRRAPLLLGLIAVVLTAGCTASSSNRETSTSSTPNTPEPPSTTSVATLENLPFDSFVEEAFRMLVVRSPQVVTEFGMDKDLDLPADRLNDLSADYSEETFQDQNELLTMLRSYSPESLSSSQEATWLAFEWYLEQQIELFPFRLHDWPVHFLVTSYNQEVIGFFTEVHPLSNRNQIEGYLSRLDEIDTQANQVLDNMAAAVEIGVLPPTYVINTTVDQLETDIAGGDPRRTVIFQAFENRVSQLGLNNATVADYLNRLESSIEESFIPAWRDLIAFLEQIRPQTTNEITLARLPDGDDFYRALLSFHTSTDLLPSEIHAMGWDEVMRIKHEMAGIGADLGLAGLGVGELRAAVVAEVGYVSSGDVASTYEELIEQAYQDFEPYFNMEPEAKITVVPGPGPGSFYIGPAADGSRPGAFHAGTGSGDVTGYTMRSLAYHEAVPGHHFQVALAQELDVPSPQRFWTNTGHVEGWALYSEHLAKDVGLYASDLASDFGRLDFELLRAARLIVDTGIHDLGWSRDEAIATMTGIMGGPDYNHEIDRYVVYPGQATAYMVGLLTILDLRQMSGAQPSDPASMAAFHDLMVGNGNLPLSVIQDLIEPAG